ncbi:hypothetical protein DERP_009386 [Dermatophagoides pteronyssinus]|uniref:Uncharacterized protein n=1 Tax=Dermatophagoides pteronyssinus TaxID=6956 RepID=A0ABQ8ITZ9_DERPT|nr:hypothetical protein DERP_009386 [Dermatophagoides pteronyssinus]
MNKSDANWMDDYRPKIMVLRRLNRNKRRRPCVRQRWTRCCCDNERRPNGCSMNNGNVNANGMLTYCANGKAVINRNGVILHDDNNNSGIKYDSIKYWCGCMASIVLSFCIEYTQINGIIYRYFVWVYRLPDLNLKLFCGESVFVNDVVDELCLIIVVDDDDDVVGSLRLFIDKLLNELAVAIKHVSTIASKQLTNNSALSRLDSDLRNGPANLHSPPKPNANLKKQKLKCVKQ